MGNSKSIVVVVLLSMSFLSIGVVSAEKLPGLHEAARGGAMGTVKKLLSEGADVNWQDQLGKTAIHYAAENGHQGTVGVLVDHGADVTILDNKGLTAYDWASRNGHSGTASLIRPAGPILKPTLKYKDLPSFEKAIKQPGCLLESKYVWFFAPKVFESSAEIIFPYLTKAYGYLHKITGIHTEYIMVIYNFPKGHKDAFGGTSNCVIYYNDSNLRLGQFEEWERYKVPHVSGYIEEMAHNFVHAAKVQFGWEMVGWSISVEAVKAVARNPIFDKDLQLTRQKQYRTYKEYSRGDYTFPVDVPYNKVDRIHAYLLWRCEKKYGKDFWRDFFANIRKRREDFAEAEKLKGKNASRNRRYQISVECFDGLEGVELKKMLSRDKISLTTDVKSLDPKSPDWDRKLH